MFLTPLQIAWEILQEAESTDFILSLSVQNIPPPHTVETYLRWLEDEAERQRAWIDYSSERAAQFQEFADRLRDLGFVPLEEPPPTSFPILNPTQTPPVCASGPMKQAAFAFY